MIKSMTGYGKSVKEADGKKITVEIKSLNSKQSDINIRIPQHYKEKEIFLRNEINQGLSRGKIDAIIWFDGNDSDKQVMFNEGLIKEYYLQLEKISSLLNRKLGDEQVLPMILKLPEVIKTEQKEIDETEWNLVLLATREALVNIDKFRIQEGEALYKDLFLRIQAIEQFLIKILPFEAERIERIRERLLQNLKDFVGAQSVDHNRFEQEMILYLEKFDITEEKVRLKHHCHYFNETMENEEMPGRKLGFIAQEIGREINTIGSKANHSEIQKIVVQMKDELEKIKEQLLNIL